MHQSVPAIGLTSLDQRQPGSNRARPIMVSAIVRAKDGTETRIGPGDGYVIQPGHDAWVVGDEPWVTVDFSQAMGDYAKPAGGP